MTRIAITGTPGTGKTTVAGMLRERRHNVIDLNAHIRENGLLEDYDQRRDTYNVDISRLNDSLKDMRGTVFMEGHLSHFLDCDIVVVLRCNPSILHERLKARGYDDEKTMENVQAEALDVILCESMDIHSVVCELDCTSASANTIVFSIEEILKGNTERYMPGSVNWGEEMVKWF